jgi:NADH:ubiquinone oxidoreductase subunit B-like Fe-S oxidoreductase
MFNNYAIVQGVDQIVPVDVYAPGCPPGPETLIHAISPCTTRSRPASSPAVARRHRRRRRHHTSSSATASAQPVARPRR